jgi:hypothetical protein
MHRPHPRAVITGWRRGSTSALLLLVLALGGGCSDSSGKPPDDGATADLPPIDFRVSVTVVDAAGERRATAHCTGDMQGTGYLAGLDHAYPACATAIVDPHVAEFLLRGEVPMLEPGCGSKPASAGLRDAQATIRVESGGERFERRLVVTDRCAELQWIDMSPLLQPESEPKVDTGKT